VALSKVPAGTSVWTTEAARRIVRDAREADHAISHVWGYSSSLGSDHRNRRCVDFMTRSTADGDWILGYLRRHEQQLRIRYIIWAGMQWRDYRKAGVPWHRMVRYWGRNQHWDHLHVEFDA